MNKINSCESFYTPKEASRELGVSIVTIYDYINKKKIKAHRLGTITILYKDDVQKFKQNKEK